MGYLNQFPNTHYYDEDLGFLIKAYKEQENKIEVLEEIYNKLQETTIATTREQLREWLEDGTLEKLIDENLLENLQSRVTTLENESKVIYVDTTEELLSKNLDNGIYITKGKANVNDGLGLKLYITNTETILPSLHMKNGNYAIPIVETFEFSRMIFNNFTDLLQKAVNTYSYITLDGLNYEITSTIEITTPVVIDMNKSTLYKNTHIQMFNGSSNFTIFNGSLNGNHMGKGYSHMITFNSTDNNLTIKDMTLYDNLYTVDGVIQQSVDSDAINIVNCKNATINNCTIRNVSRNGIAITGSVDIVDISNNNIEECYLFGIDLEPNTPTESMMKNVTIKNNLVLDCGRGESDYVWNTGGGFSCGSGNTTIKFVEQLNLIDNEFCNRKYYTSVSGQVAPFNRVQQMRYLKCIGNTFETFTRNLFFAQPSSLIDLATISNNQFTRLNAIPGNNVYIQATEGFVMFTNNYSIGPVNIATATESLIFNENNKIIT